MKTKLLPIALLLLSTTSFAQTFSGIYKSNFILKSSDSDFVCKVLTKNNKSTAVSVEYGRVDRADCFYKMKNGKIKLKCNTDPAMTDIIIPALNERAVIFSIDCAV